MVTRIFFLNAYENHWRAAFATNGDPRLAVAGFGRQQQFIDIRLNDIRSSLPFGRMNRHGSTAFMANVSRSTAAARSRGSMVNISIEWEACVGASIIVATRR